MLKLNLEFVLFVTSHTYASTNIHI